MNKHSTSRPATPEERTHVIEFLQNEYALAHWGLNTNEPHNDDKTIYCDNELPIEQNFGRIEELVNSFTLTTYPDFFADGDLIELRVWEIDFLNTEQLLKQSANGKLTRSPFHSDRTQHIIREQVCLGTNDWSLKCLCGNEPNKDGFTHCNTNLEVPEWIDDVRVGRWICCNLCGRIFDNNTGMVVGFLPKHVIEPVA